MYEFFIEMDCLGAYSYNVQQTENLRNLKSQNLGGGLCLLRQVKYDSRTKLQCLKALAFDIIVGKYAECCIIVQYFRKCA